MRNSFLLLLTVQTLTLTFGFHIVASPAFAQSSEDVSVSFNRSARSLTIAADAGVFNNCTIEFFASPRRAQSVQKSVRLGGVTTTADAVQYTISRLPARIKSNGIRKNANLFVHIEAVCNGIPLTTIVSRFRMATGQRGKSKRSFLRFAARRALLERVQIVAFLDGVQFSSPVDIQTPRDGSGRIFIVEQNGRIQLIQSDQSVSQYLDISERVSTGGERGLLGLAFAPDFATSGQFYVNYTNVNGDTVVSRFEVSDPSGVLADSSQETIILEVEQPFGNHNGGGLQFGPDGMLYIGLGDGGGAGDPDNNGQDPTTLLGSMLRIDVRGGGAYSIPSDNPFVGNTQGIREEAFATGLRNPFRYSFDSETGLLWAGDVGQNAFEEIDIIRAGENYGWNIVEGNSCFQSSSCRKKRFAAPIRVYDRTKGQSVTGGYVYRGSLQASFHGYYIHGDFISGRIWALSADVSRGFTVELEDTDFLIPSFGVTEDGRLLFADYGSGQLYELQG